MIEFSNVRYRYPDKGEGWALDGIDLTIGAGEYVLLCGRSGSGKSTLGYLFNGLIPHFFGGVLEGRVFVGGRDTRLLSAAETMEEAGLVFQNSDAQLFCGTVEQEIAFGLESLGLPGKEIDRRVRDAAEMLEIEGLLERSPVVLSGGEKRLAAIASVLSLDPPLLLLDEPLAHLDWKGVKRVCAVLRRLHRRGKTLVVAEQRVGMVAGEASRCLVMDRGKIVYDGDPDSARPIMLGLGLIPAYPEKRRTAAASRGETLLSAEGLGFSTDGRPILQEVSLEVRSGEILAVVGSNGSGKTTLAKHLNGLLRGSSGDLRLAGKDIRGKTPSELASLVGVSFQNPNDQFFKVRVEEELLAGPRALKRFSSEWFEETCSLFDLEQLLDRSPYRLSEGQKKRVAVASIFLMRPALLVLDEPTLGQDGRSLEALAGMLMSLQERGFTVVVVTHDLDFALAVADEWAVMHGGRVVGRGSPDELLGNENLLRLGALGRGREPEERDVSKGGAS